MSTESETIAALMARGYNEHLRLHGPDGDGATANGTAVVVERDGEEYAARFTPMNHEEEQLSGRGSLLEQRAERRAWQCADDAASVLRAFGAGSGMARELLTEALRHLDTLAKRKAERNDAGALPGGRERKPERDEGREMTRPSDFPSVGRFAVAQSKATGHYSGG